MKFSAIQVVCFDADDTLWPNEPYFQEAEQRFCALLEDFMPHHSVSQELFRTEMQNLPLYGYGIKAFMLSMIETILRVTEDQAPAAMIRKAIEYGKELLDKPIELFPEVNDVLTTLSGRYRLVVATKGDLLDQERKLKKSGIAHFFQHIEIMSEKKESDYLKLLQHLDCDPLHFLMIGNSLKSDILPVLEVGGYGVHIPFHTTWAHEMIQQPVEHPRLERLSGIGELLKFFPS